MTDILDHLRDIVGAAGVVTGDDLSARTANWVTGIAEPGMAMVRPRSTAEVSAIMKLCHAKRQAVIPFGGNTGLVHGLQGRDGILFLSLDRMNAVEEIDPIGATMTVQAGAILQNVQDAAADAGLLFPLDLGARGSCQIGGNIATNAGGNSVIRYGMMREQVLGLEVVLADGTVLSSMNRMLKNNSGYDLKQLFIGSEGTLGIVTRAVLRQRPAMPAACTALVAAESYDKVTRLLQALSQKSAGGLSAFEVMWSDFFKTILGGNPKHVSPISGEYPFYILVETTGVDQVVEYERFESMLGEAVEAGLVADAVIAATVDQASRLWAVRDDVETVVRTLHPAIAFDISLPQPVADTYVKAVKAGLAAKFGAAARMIAFGHLGDGNIHICATVGSAEAEPSAQVMDIVYENLKPFGGAISAEHGIGTEKRPYLSVTRSDAEIALMRQIKAALDPMNILNPGKVLMPE